ncbi:MAG: DUF5320 domain-containing protein [Deltaproteobacteria bacterium]|nr:DUF5320 domain-containing protein [Deltaproteobacteria bacterium]
MPRKDGTGPMGNGPQTGWGNGDCVDASESDNTPQTRGRGFGRGSGRRRGNGGNMGRGPMAGRGSAFAASNPEDEKHHLENHKEILQSQINDLNNRLDDLKAQGAQAK